MKLRYFAGLSIDEAADLLGISPHKCEADWAYARAWLLAELPMIRRKLPEIFEFAWALPELFRRIEMWKAKSGELR